MLGPVFRFELITTARRKRYYVARVLYGLFLLFWLGSQYGAGDWSRYATINLTSDGIEAMNQFAQRMFSALTWAQGTALVCLVPALLAGVIADEAQRKTLHYLLASRMSSAEIVLGKLGARLLHVGVIVLMGVPVVCLLALYGSLDPLEVAYVYTGTFSLVLFVAGVSLLVSVLARRPREAIVAAYVLVFVWLVLPLAIGPDAHHMGWPLQWVGPVNDFVLLTNPAFVAEVMPRISQHQILDNNALLRALLSRFSNEVLALFLTMAGLQAGIGVACLALAIVGLRPLHGGEGRRAVRKERGPLIAAIARVVRTETNRPPCDEDNPMLWKERFAAGGGFTWLRSGLTFLFLSVLLGCYLYDTALPAFAEQFGWRLRWAGADARLELNGALRQSTSFLFVLTLLSVASAAAVSMTSEREQDTWTSLTATLLTSREVVMAKVWGALWSSKRLLAALLILWGAGLLAGAVHPLGAMAAVVGLFVFCGFTAALGVWFSLRAKNSTRALFATIVWLLVLNGGYLILVPERFRESAVVGAGLMPSKEWAVLISYRDASLFSEARSFQTVSTSTVPTVETLVAYLIAVFGYGLGAVVLGEAAISGYDKAVGRPRRDRVRADKARLAAEARG